MNDFLIQEPVPFFILGTGGHAKEMILLVDDINSVMQDKLLISGILSDDLKNAPKTFCKHVVTDEKTSLDCLRIKPNVLIGIGSPEARKIISEKLKDKVNFPYFIHPSVQYTLFKDRWVTALDQLSSKAMSDGVVICKGVNLTTDVRLGEHVHLNTGCTVCHDVEIGDYSIVSPNATVCGNVTIGKECYIGAGAVIRDGITIADKTFIGAGTVVVKDIMETGNTYIGVPAKELIKND